MSDRKEYVAPPSSRVTTGQGFFAKTKGVYGHLKPDFWKRKLIHLIIVIPACYYIYSVLFTSLFHTVEPGILEKSLSALLTGIAAFFYPFSLWWYRESFLGRLLNGIYHVGGFFAVILKVLLTLVVGVVFAGFFSPITGVLMWRKCVKRDLIIGDAQDFY